MHINMEVCGNPLKDTQQDKDSCKSRTCICLFSVFYEFIFCERETCCVVNSLHLCSQNLFASSLSFVVPY
jgi:hypothetical protein